MTKYKAIAEVGVVPSERRTTSWMSALAAYAPTVGHSEHKLAEITITLDAAFMEAASAEGLAVMNRVLGPLRSFEVMSADEYNRRAELLADVDYLGTVDAANLLGVTRQRMQQLAASGAVPSIRIGKRTLGFSRSQVRAIALRRVSGAQLMVAALEVIKKRPELQTEIKSIMPKLAELDRSADAEIKPNEERLISRLFDLLDEAGVPWPTPPIDTIRAPE